MKMLYDDSGETLVMIFDKKEGQAITQITEAAISGKALNKRSAAYKIAKKIDDDLPVY